MLAEALLHIQPRNLLLYAYAIVSPFFVFSIATGRETPANWIALLLGILMLFDVIQRFGQIWWHRALTYGFLLLGIYLLWTLVIAIQEPSNTWAGRTPLQRALGINVRWIVMIFTFTVLIHHLVGVSRSVFVRVLELQLLIGMLLSLFGLLQVFLLSSLDVPLRIEPSNEAFQLRSNLFRIGREQVFRASSVFSEPSYFGFYLVPLIVKAVVSFRHKIFIFNKKWLHVGLIATLLTGFIGSFSLTAIFALVTTVLIVALMSLRSSPKLSVILLSLIGVISFVMLSSHLGDLLLTRTERVFRLADLSTLARVFSGYIGLLIFWQNPWTGVGPGGFAFHYPTMGIFVDKELMHTPLNTWLMVLTDVGLIGFIPFIGLVWIILSSAWRARENDALVQIYFWSVISFLVLLTTVDLWYIDLVWLEFAILLVLSTGPLTFARTRENHPS